MGETDSSWIHLVGSSTRESSLNADLIGSKAANLLRLSAVGLNVPPAMAVSTALCRHYLLHGQLPPEFEPQLRAGLVTLEQLAKRTLGGDPPLLLAVRSSPPVSMPGMLRTILNVGLGEDGVQRMVRVGGDARLAWDTYRRHLLSLAAGHPAAEAALARVSRDFLGRVGVESLHDLDPLELRDLARLTLQALAEHTGHTPATDPFEQVRDAVIAVLESWRSPWAAEYRRMHGLDDHGGTGVLIQAMIFGNSGPQSGSGVGFTRNPATGARELYVDFLFGAQGEDIVSGRSPVVDRQLLPAVLPEVWRQLQAAQATLEREFTDMQDFEFTVEDGRLFFLQTRAGKRTPLAALRIALALVDEQRITPATACERLAAYDLESIGRTVLQPPAGTAPLARATAASVGVASGVIVFDAERARTLSAHGSVILVRTELSTEDLPGFRVASGILTALGGRTSHAAVIARQLGKVCLVGCHELRIDEAERTCTLGARRLHEGDVITLDSEGGAIYDGPIPSVIERPTDDLARVSEWRAQQPAVAVR